MFYSLSRITIKASESEYFYLYAHSFLLTFKDIDSVLSKPFDKKQFRILKCLPD